MVLTSDLGQLINCIRTTYRNKDLHPGHLISIDHAILGDVTLLGSRIARHSVLKEEYLEFRLSVRDFGEISKFMQADLSDSIRQRLTAQLSHEDLLDQTNFHNADSVNIFLSKELYEGQSQIAPIGQFSAEVLEISAEKRQDKESHSYWLELIGTSGAVDTIEDIRQSGGFNVYQVFIGHDDRASIFQTFPKMLFPNGNFDPVAYLTEDEYEKCQELLNNQLVIKNRYGQIQHGVSQLIGYCKQADTISQAHDTLSNAYEIVRDMKFPVKPMERVDSGLISDYFDHMYEALKNGAVTKEYVIEFINNHDPIKEYQAQLNLDFDNVINAASLKNWYNLLIRERLASIDRYDIPITASFSNTSDIPGRLISLYCQHSAPISGREYRALTDDYSIVKNSNGKTTVKMQLSLQNPFFLKAQNAITEQMGVRFDTDKIIEGQTIFYPLDRLAKVNIADLKPIFLHYG